MQPRHKPITFSEALAYEVRASWWADSVPWNWLQTLAARYFAWKVGRKYRRYMSSHQQRLEAIEYLKELHLKELHAQNRIDI